MKLTAIAGLAALSAATSALPAYAEEDSLLWLNLLPGESQTFFVNSQEGASSLPVFRVCYRSPLGYTGAIVMTQANKGEAYGPVQIMAPGDCLFVSGEKLVARIDKDLPSGPQENPKMDAAALADQPSIFLISLVRQ